MLLVGICGVFFFAFDSLSGDFIEECKEGNCQKDTQNTKEAAANQDCQNNENGRKLQGVCNQSWLNEVGVNLLENNHCRRNNQACGEVLRECGNHRSQHRCHDSTEIGNQVEATHNKCQKHRILDPKQSQYHKGKTKHNQGIQ